MQVIECIIQQNIKIRQDLTSVCRSISLSFSREEDDKLERYVEELVLQVSHLALQCSVNKLDHIVFS